jgi:hypothetical protein
MEDNRFRRPADDEVRPRDENLIGAAVQSVIRILLQRQPDSAMKLDELVAQVVAEGFSPSAARWAIDECQHRKWIRANSSVEISSCVGSPEPAWQGHMVSVRNKLREHLARNDPSANQLGPAAYTSSPASQSANGRLPRRRGRRVLEAGQKELYERLAAAWATGDYSSYAMLAQAMNITEKVVRHAVDWHRKRERRASK